jgi:hypothetical protein
MKRVYSPLAVGGKKDWGDFPMRIQLRSFALALALSTIIGAARADVIVSGTLDHLHIEAKQASIVEVLEALKKKFGIVYQYRAHADLTVDGAFTGSLSAILPLIFRGKDYAFGIDADNSVTVYVVSPQGPPPLDLPVPPAPVKAHMLGEKPSNPPVSLANPPPPQN